MIITFRQVLGWFLVIVGLYIVFWDMAESYYYFTAQKEFPQVFLAQTTTKTESQESSNSMNDLAKQIIEQQMNQLLPENSVSQLLNMTAWIAFASFMLFAGAKVVGLGTGFMRES